jgi:general secretion pathway protein B
VSYILDALRRADAERERGGVPSLHTQQYGALPGDDDAPRPPRLLLTVIVVLVLALGSALAWNLWGGRDAAPRATAQTGVLTPPPVAAVTAPALPAPVPAAPTPAPAVAAAVPATPASAADGPEARRQLLAAAAAMRAERRGTAHPRAPLPVPAPASPSTATASPGKLPDALRRELPALAFGGASFSKDPASRMVIFNGRVFHEGDVIAPDLVLQQIRNKAAIFTYRGYTYQVDF